MEDLRISASNLGLFVMPDFCERCAWLLLKMRHRFPFQRPFPGVMFHLDRQQKASSHQHFEKHGKPPKWFGPFADAKSDLDTGKLIYTDPESGVELRGAPDEVVILPDGSLAVIDFKTAKHKEGKDVLFPKYEVQVNAYALLLHQEEGKKVSKGGLLYFQIQTDYDDDELLDLITKDGLDVHFKAVPVEMELDPEKIVLPLLMETRKLFKRRTPPAGKDGCKDCELLARMASLAKLGQLKDQADLERFVEFHMKRHRSDDEEISSFNPNGIFTLWDFDDEE